MEVSSVLEIWQTPSRRRECVQSVVNIEAISSSSASSVSIFGIFTVELQRVLKLDEQQEQEEVGGEEGGGGGDYKLNKMEF